MAVVGDRVSFWITRRSNQPAERVTGTVVAVRGSLCDVKAPEATYVMLEKDLMRMPTITRPTQTGGPQ